MAFDWPLSPFDSENHTYEYYFDVPTGRIKETSTGLVYPYTWVLTQDATGFKNPKQFASAETAEVIHTWAEKHFSSPSFSAYQLNSQSPYSSAPFFGEFTLEASSNFDKELFNIGLLAFTLAKFGDSYAREFFIAQMKQAGLTVVVTEEHVVVEPAKPEKPAVKPSAKPLTEKEKKPVEGIMNQDNVSK